MKSKKRYRSVKKINNLVPTVSDLVKNRFKSYNKTLLVGHSSTEYKYILELLYASGMGTSNSLTKYNVTANEISDILYKTSNKDLTNQVDIEPIWNGIALDLYMSNIKQEWWGWADSNAISLLNYWDSIDSQISFVLVYNTPEDFLYNYIVKSDSTLNNLDEAVDKWLKYNEILLNFFYRNQKKSILINAEQVKKDNNTFLNKNDKVLEYLIEELVKKYPTMIDTFEEIQSVANVPAKEFMETNRDLTNKEKLKILIEEQQENSKLKEDNKQLFVEFQHIQEELEKKYLTNKELQDSQKEKEIEKKRVREENELLLTQLHHVQEELEKKYLTNKELQDTQKEEEIEKKKFNEENELLLTQLHQVQEELEKKHLKNKELQDTQKEKEIEKKKFNEENELLLTQLHQVQEELEKYYLENRELKEKEIAKERFYGAGNRIKEQFDYKLGAKVLKKLKSPFGIVSLPFSLIGVYGEYKRESSRERELLPIEKYVDAYEAERVKKHLTYMLGETTTKTMKNPLGIFILPFRYLGTYKKFKKNRS